MRVLTTGEVTCPPKPRNFKVREGRNFRQDLLNFGLVRNGEETKARILKLTEEYCHLITRSVLFLESHAAGCPEFWYEWRHVMPILAANGFRTLAIDMRGFGETTEPLEDESFMSSVGVPFIDLVFGAS